MTFKKNILASVFIITLGLFISNFALLPNKVSAETLIVNSKLDNGDGTCTIEKCTLKDAVANSNEGDTITFGNLTGTIKVNSQIVVDHSISIQGPGADNLALDFKNIDGYNPKDSLIKAQDGNFYGMTSIGGLNGFGTIFSFNPANVGNEYKVIHSFSYNDGTYPQGSLVESNGIFYGMTYEGGLNNYGTIFSYDPSAELGSEYQVIHNFSNNNIDGAYPFGSLTVHVESVDGEENILFYGMTSEGGSNNYGTIFSYNPSAELGSEYQVIYSFGNNDGNNPKGSLIESNGIFYGMTSTGGNGFGTIFSYNPSAESGSEYHVMHSFDGYEVGSYPQGSLVVSNGIFYGMTSTGGLYGFGTIFSYNPTATENKYQVIHSFSPTTDGYNPQGSLIESGGIFYGMTSIGGLGGLDGSDGFGTIFSYNPSAELGSEYNVMHNFNRTNGDGPSGSLLKLNNVLYGETNSGGINNSGTIFSYDLTGEGSYSILKNFSGEPNIKKTNGNLNISGLTFSNGHTPILNNTGNLDISDSKIINNYGAHALYTGESNVTLDNVLFNNNTAGSIYVYSGSITINNSVLSNNSTTDDSGGAIYLNGGILSINNSTFSNNSSTEDGGAIYAKNGDVINITNSTFSNNTAGRFGTIESYATTTNITNSTFKTDNPDQDYAVLIGGDSNVTNSIFYSINDNNCYSNINSKGHNIESGTTCGFNKPGDVYNPTKYTKIYDFNPTNGYGPLSSLVQAQDGSFYGITTYGGTDNAGVIFKWDGTEYSVLHSFSSETGYDPKGSLIQAQDGKFYGVTAGGGATGQGVIFKLDGAVYTVVHNFDGTNGAMPRSSLIQAQDGSFYGVTAEGGEFNQGVIFKFDGTNYTNLYDFSSTTGSYPQESLFQAQDGSFYGVANGGVINEQGNDQGVIFKLKGAVYTVVHYFDEANGINPRGSLIQTEDGSFYGVTIGGGANGVGVIFKLKGTDYTVVHNFDNSTGAAPFTNSLIKAQDGILYGITEGGGANVAGVIFKLDGNNYTDLYDFNGIIGTNPKGSLIQAQNGYFYGVTGGGGKDSIGTIFSYNLNPIHVFDSTTILDPEGLKDNGGPVPTIALLEGSPAINTGDDTAAPSKDARGMSRVNTSDIGAYEYQGSSTPPTNTLLSIEITNPATKLSYYVGDRLDISGLVVTGTYSDSPTTKTESITSGNITGFDSRTPVTGQTLTITVGSKTTTYTVNIVAAPVTQTHNSSSGSTSVVRTTPTVSTTTTSQPKEGCSNGNLFNTITGKACEKINTPSSTQTPTTYNLGTKILKNGSRGNAVKELQRFLNDKLNLGLIIDGILGPKTIAVIKKWQKDHGLVADGLIGPKTKALMK